MEGVEGVGPVSTLHWQVIRHPSRPMPAGVPTWPLPMTGVWYELSCLDGGQMWRVPLESLDAKYVFYMRDFLMGHRRMNTEFPDGLPP